MHEHTPTPGSQWWVAAMRFCVLELNLPPTAFWSLSLPELEMLLGLQVGLQGQGGVIARDEFENLMMQYPDERSRLNAAR